MQASPNSGRNQVKRDFLTLKDYTTLEIRQILDIAKDVKAHPEKYKKALEGKELALLFQKTSTRTRVSFEVGIHQLGGQALYLDWRTTNFTLGDIQDEIRCMSRYVDVIMARVYEHKDVELMANAATVPVINGLSDSFHPCQALADIMTIEEFWNAAQNQRNNNSLEKPKIVFIGDGNNNVAASLIVICAKLDLPLTVISPKEFQPSNELISWLKENNLVDKIEITDDITLGIKDADFIYTDTFVSMGQEAESKRRLEVFSAYQVNRELVVLSGKDPYILHCLPAHREIEITSDVLDSDKSIVYDQAENRLHAQKALLLYLLKLSGLKISMLDEKFDI